jgi:hypothetical protein
MTPPGALAVLGSGCALLLVGGLAGWQLRRRDVARWKRLRPVVLAAGLLGCLLAGLGALALFVTLTQGPAALAGPRMAGHLAGYALMGALVAFWWWHPGRRLEPETQARTAIAGLLWPVTLTLSLSLAAMDWLTPRRAG